MIQTSPLEIKDFKGGMTDYYLGGPLNKFQLGENLLLVKYGDIAKLFTRPGSEIYDEDNPQIPAGAQRIGALKYFSDTLFYQSARKLYYVLSGSFTTLQGPTSNDLFPTGVDTTTVISTAVWNGHLFVTSSAYTKMQKIYSDSGGTFRLRTAGMPDLASAPTVTRGAASGGNDYLYKFLHKYTYTVGTVTFIDRGPTTEVFLDDSEDPGTSAVSITSIPVLANGTTHNYDTSNVKIEIYRTTNNGVNFFRVGEVTNGTTTFNDNVSNLTLLNNEPLYTEGGIVENDDPPLAQVVHIVDDKSYLGNIKIGTEIFSNRVYQGIPGDPDSVPADFYVELQDAVVAISSVRSSPVVLCTNFIYRLDGAYDELGRGIIEPLKISDAAGCISSASVVQTIDGIFWAGNDGFYFSDGYRVIRISQGIEQTYQSIISTAERKRRIVGKYDAKKRRIYWTAQLTTAATEVDAFFVLDLNWGLSDDMPFTTWAGTSFSPTAIEFIGENLLRGDRRGYTFIHRDTLYVDPKIDTGVAAEDWEDEAIIYDYVSVATDFGTSFARKWVPRIEVTCKNETNLSLQITSINDDGRRTADLKPIRSRNNVTWGDPDIYWGDPDVIWNYQGLIDEQRRFPAMSLRCEYKQIQLTNAHVAIISSDVLGTAAIDSSAKTVTLDDAASKDWPSNAVDYFVAFELDNYVREYLITARTDDELTYSDSSNNSSSATGSEWVIRGRPKGEILHLIGYVVDYAVFGKTQTQFHASTTGEPGADNG